MSIGKASFERDSCALGSFRHTNTKQRSEAKRAWAKLCSKVIAALLVLFGTRTQNKGVKPNERGQSFVHKGLLRSCGIFFGVFFTMFLTLLTASNNAEGARQCCWTGGHWVATDVRLTCGLTWRFTAALGVDNMLSKVACSKTKCDSLWLFAKRVNNKTKHFQRFKDWMRLAMVDWM
jgi:hypothetical protein